MKLSKMLSLGTSFSCAVVAAGVLFVQSHVPAVHAASAPGVADAPVAGEPAPLYETGNGEKKYTLKMHHLHTGESLDVTYRVGNRYVPSAIAMLNHFLRDHRTGAEANYDPREFDVLNALMKKVGRPNGTIDIVCGYRSPWSNNYLREHTQGVAEHSQHMLSKAIDIRVPGVSTRKLDFAALSLGDGGVGYYPHSQFVHVDVGPVRHWTLM